MNLETNLLLFIPAAAAILTTGTSTSAQELSADSLTTVKNLQEIVVTAPETEYYGNKTSFFPTKEMKATMTGGIQLLAGLQLTGLSVNPASGNIALLGGKTLSLRINGRPATNTDIASIASKDIIRIDYITNPGRKYGNADAVIDITVRRKQSGYGIMLNLLQSLNRGWGNYVCAVNYNIGRSEWAVDYNSNPMWDMDCHRDNKEWLKLADGSKVSRIETGIKSPNRMATHHTSLRYSYADGDRMMLNMQLRLSLRDDKYVSAGHITTVTGPASSTCRERETSPIKSNQGDLDLYAHYRINRNNKIFINIVPTVINGKNRRTYESPEISLTSDISTSGTHLLAECAWESNAGRGQLSAGFRSLNGWIKATQSGYAFIIRETESVNSIFAEWSQTINDVQYTTGAEVTLHSLRHPVKYKKALVNPRFSLSVSPFSWGTLSLSLNTFTVTPSINCLNPARQQIDTYQWAEGNLSLRPFQRHESRIEFHTRFNEIAASISLRDRYCHNPAMEAKSHIDGCIVKSYFNDGYNNDFEIKGAVRMPLFTNHLSMSLEGGWHSAVSSGINYLHRYSQPFVNAQLMFMTGKWWIMLKYNNAYNRLWGETIESTDNNLFNIGVGYTCRNATFSAGIVNPIGNIAIRTTCLSSTAGYERQYNALGSHQLLWVGVTLNMHKGKKHLSRKKRLENINSYETINNQVK